MFFYTLDFFVANIEIESLDISKEFTHVIQFLATETKIVMKTYQIEMNQEAIENKVQIINDDRVWMKE